MSFEAWNKATKDCLHRNTRHAPYFSYFGNFSTLPDIHSKRVCEQNLTKVICFAQYIVVTYFSEPNFVVLSIKFFRRSEAELNDAQWFEMYSVYFIQWKLIMFQDSNFDYFFLEFLWSWVYRRKQLFPEWFYELTFYNWSFNCSHFNEHWALSGFRLKSKQSDANNHINK